MIAMEKAEILKKTKRINN